ncbi:MAG: DHCW motif cupin fold protein [Chitinophagaceae bacterium]|nr:DHCW motif cupin fold protein [Chitinophagaceae bacterium]
MEIKSFSFQTLNWASIPKVEYAGTTGIAFWQTFLMGNIRVRMVEYSANYLADHWCSKGHIILCVDGNMETELQDGRKFMLEKGMTYHVGDDCEAHRSASVCGCKLFIVD